MSRIEEIKDNIELLRVTHVCDFYEYCHDLIEEIAKMGKEIAELKDSVQAWIRIAGESQKSANLCAAEIARLKQLGEKSGEEIRHLRACIVDQADWGLCKEEWIAKIARLNSLLEEAASLIDSVTEIVEMYSVVQYPAQQKWKKDWLEKAMVIIKKIGESR